jgi:hypothetical protein
MVTDRKQDTLYIVREKTTYESIAYRHFAYPA